MESDFFSLVVVGSMNPQLHHPYWYRHQDLIDEGELTQALAQGFVSVPPLSQFEAGGLAVLCEASRWMISVKDRALAERAHGVAKKVFKLLDHTPVERFGMNFNCHRTTTIPDVGVSLFAAAPQVATGKGTGRVDLRYRFIEDARMKSVRIEPSNKNPNMVYVGINFDHQIVAPVSEGYDYFDLAALLDSAFDEDRREADEDLKRALASLQRS